MVSGKDAYFVAPPRMIIDDLVNFATMAPGNRYVVCWCSELPGKKFGPLFEAMTDKGLKEVPKQSVQVWDVTNDHLMKVRQEAGAPAPPPAGLTWSSQPGTAYFIGGGTTAAGQPNTDFALYRFSASDATVRRIVNLDSSWQGDFSDVLCSPTQPWVVLYSVSMEPPVPGQPRETRAKFRTYDVQGKLLKQTEIKVKGSFAFSNNWSKDGKYVLGKSYRRQEGQDRANVKLAVFSPTDGTLNETGEDIQPYTVEPDPTTLELVARPLDPVVDKIKVRLESLWLHSKTESEQPWCMVAAEYDDTAFLLPNASTVAYVAKGRLYSVELAKADLKLFEAARDAAARTAALSRAKQVALAVMLYLTDHDDNFPDPSGFPGSIQQYLGGNESLLDGFVYTFAGGNANSIASPATTELGYITVSGGRCVAYSDGHAKYVPDP